MKAKINDKNIEAMAAIKDDSRLDADLGLMTPASMYAEKEANRDSPDVKQEFPSLAPLTELNKVVKSAQLTPTSFLCFHCGFLQSTPTIQSGGFVCAK